MGIPRALRKRPLQELTYGSMYPIIGYMGVRVIVIVVQVLGKYMIIEYLDPLV